MRKSRIDTLSPRNCLGKADFLELAYILQIVAALKVNVDETSIMCELLKLGSSGLLHSQNQLELEVNESSS